MVLGVGISQTLLVALVVLALASSSPRHVAFAQNNQQQQHYRKLVTPSGVGAFSYASSPDVLPGRFLVKLRPKSGDTAARSGGAVQSRAQSIVTKMRRQKMPVRMVNEFRWAWKGFSLQADDPAKLAKVLTALDSDFDVLSFYPVVWISAPDCNITELNSTNLRGAYSARTSSAPTSNTSTRLVAAGRDRLDGNNVKVGIIDTGVDYTHPALAGKVQYQYDFVGDAFQSGGVPNPKNDSMDCAGHGTHVAGIIAGSYTSPGFNYSGVAPGVVLGAYKVFGCNGSTTSEMVVAAMDRAAQDGMQIINLSIGDDGAWQGPVADAAAQLTAMGIMVVAAVGNAGPSGLFMPTSAANAPSALAVASVQSYAAPAALKFRVSGVDGGGRYSIRAAFGNFTALAGAVVRPSAAALPAGGAGPGASASGDGCGSDPGQLGDFAGAVALLALGGCSPAVKIANAVARRAAGVMLYGDDTSVDDVRRIPLLGSPGSWPSPSSPFAVPVLAVDTATGRSLHGAFVRASNASPGPSRWPRPLNSTPAPSSSSAPPPSPPGVVPPSPAPPAPLPKAQAPGLASAPGVANGPGQQQQQQQQQVSGPASSSATTSATSPSPSSSGLNSRQGPGSAQQPSVPSPGMPAQAPGSGQPGRPSAPRAPTPQQQGAPSDAVTDVTGSTQQQDGTVPSPGTRTAAVATVGPGGRRLLQGGHGRRLLAAEEEAAAVAASGWGRGWGARQAADTAAQGRQLQQAPSSGGFQLPTIVEITGSLASPFSAWGPSPELRIKPTVVAPGGAILSTVPQNRNLSSSGFAYLSGTSQAAPYVTGAVALAMEAGRARNVTPAQLEAALVTTAVPLRDVSDPSTSTQPSLPATSLLRVGAGVADIPAMVNNLLDLNLTRMELGSILASGGKASYIIEASNRGSAPLSFQLLHSPAASVDASELTVIDPVIGANNSRRALPYDAPLLRPAAEVAFSSTRVMNLTSLTVPAGGRTRFKVTLNLASWVAPADQLLFSGYLLLSPLPPSANDSFSDPAAIRAAQLQPPLYLPYMGYSQPLTSMPLLLQSLPAGISDPTGAWVWDVNGTGLLSGTEAPPPYAYVSYYDDEPSLPPRTPPSSDLVYWTSGPRASLPSIALFIQRQPAAQEIGLYRASDDSKIGTITLTQTIRRPTSGQPFIINWRGTYFDLIQRREMSGLRGDFYFVVKLTRVAALNEDPSSAPCEAWKSPAFTLRAPPQPSPS